MLLSTVKVIFANLHSLASPFGAFALKFPRFQFTNNGEVRGERLEV